MMRELYFALSHEALYVAGCVLKVRGAALRDRLCAPNVTLAPDGDPYLFRWYLVHGNALANVYFHVQVKSDPERPLHDHPWDNTSVILYGGYDEVYQRHPAIAGYHESKTRFLRKGDIVHRKATTAHRLILPPPIPYTMTLFTTGPKVREWGFWYEDGFHHNKRHCDDRNSGVGMVSTGRHD